MTASKMASQTGILRNLNQWLISRASSSVPPLETLNLIKMPMPSPCRIPPYTAARMRLSVMLGITVNSSLKAPRTTMVSRLRRINFQPICFQPSRRMGILTATVTMPMPTIPSVSRYTRVAMPEAPPPTISLCTKKQSTPSAYRQQPTSMAPKRSVSVINNCFFCPVIVRSLSRLSVRALRRLPCAAASPARCGVSRALRRFSRAAAFLARCGVSRALRRLPRAVQASR